MNNGDTVKVSGGVEPQGESAPSHFHAPDPHIAAQIEVVRYWSVATLTAALRITSYGNPEHIPSEVLAGAIANGVWNKSDQRFEAACYELYRRATAGARACSRKGTDLPESRREEVVAATVDAVVDQLLQSGPGSFLACRFSLVVTRAYLAASRRYTHENQMRTDDAMMGADGMVTMHTNEAADATALAAFDAVEDRERVRAALAGLPQPHQEALLLTAMYGCTHAEAAERLGVTDRTIRTWCRAAAEHVRAELGEG
ncbi:MAG: hypothetical protein KGJ62_12305 [Armatimonadetes bacterium]|nr:hypothetical protein [Armatimonadota bacterium]MDE2206512.1 hypothetical protein [Armatimonadota bacterium]